MYAILLQELRQQPLLMASHVLHAIEQAAIGSEQDTSKMLADPERERVDRAGVTLSERVAVIPVTGPLFHRASGYMLMGVTTYQGVASAVRAATRDESVNEIILDIHSPGGVASGCFEAAAEIAEMAKEKRITAVVNEAAFSGAYMLAAAATERVVPESGSVGSIGVVMTHVDVSKAAEQVGFRFTHLFRGKHKVDGTPYESLTEQAKAEFDRQLDQSYSLFTSSVAQMLGVPEQQIRETEARIYTGDDAVRAGLADRVVKVRDFLSEVAARNDDDDEGENEMLTKEQQQKAKQLQEQAAELGLEIPGIDKMATGNNGGDSGQMPPAAAEGGADQSGVESIEQAASRARQEEMSRFGDIQTLCKQAGREDLSGDLYSRGLSVEQARTELFNVMAAEDESSSVNSHLGSAASGTAEAQEEQSLLAAAVDGFNARSARG